MVDECHHNTDLCGAVHTQLCAECQQDVEAGHNYRCFGCQMCNTCKQQCVERDAEIARLKGIIDQAWGLPVVSWDNVLRLGRGLIRSASR